MAGPEGVLIKIDSIITYPPPFLTQGLVCLIAGKVKPEPATPLEGKERSDLYVLKVWQRFVASDSTWVVALLLRNDSQT